MNVESLISIALAGVSVGLAVWISRLIIPTWREKNASYYITLIFFIIIALAVKTAAMNGIRKSPLLKPSIEEEVDRVFATNDFYRILLKHYPEKRGYLRASFIKYGEEYKKTGELSLPDELYVEMIPMIEGRLKYTTNENAQKYYREVLIALDSLRKVSPELALAYMFPGSGDIQRASRAVTPQQKLAMFKTLEEVFISSDINPQPVPDLSIADAMIEEIVDQNIDAWSAKYGEDLPLLASAFEDNSLLGQVDSAKAVDFTMDFLSIFVKLPPEQGGYIIRSLHSR